MTHARLTSSHHADTPHLPTGWTLKAFDSLDGTNAALKRMVEAGTDVAEGLTVTAAEQTAGRGRSGRGWNSPRGNLYASILVAAPQDQSKAPQLGFVASLAVRDAILDMPRHNAPPPELKLKWPNDVLIHGAKCCGILLESAAAPGGPLWTIVGVGINLKPVDVAGAAYPVTSLLDHGVDVAPAAALTLLTRDLQAWLGRWREQGFGAVRESWLRSGPAPGETVGVRLNGDTVTGAFAGLDGDGALLLDAGQSAPVRIVAGDVLPGGVS